MSHILFSNGDHSDLRPWPLHMWEINCLLPLSLLCKYLCAALLSTPERCRCRLLFVPKILCETVICNVIKVLRIIVTFRLISNARLIKLQCLSTKRLLFVFFNMKNLGLRYHWQVHRLLLLRSRIEWLKLEIPRCAAAVMYVFEDDQFLLHEMLLEIHPTWCLIKSTSSPSWRIIEQILKIFLGFHTWEWGTLFIASTVP